MMFDDDYNNFEKFPGGSIEKGGEREVPKDQDFGEIFKEGVPEFSGGEQFGAGDGEKSEGGMENNEGIMDAAALINYGLNAAAKKYGVETVVQRLIGLDVSGSGDPIGDFYSSLGVETVGEYKKLENENEATKVEELELREKVGVPVENRSVEGAREAIRALQDLARGVVADPRYEELRDGARTAGKGYFDYAVSDLEVQGLPELFQVLATQSRKSENGDIGNEGNEEGKESEDKKSGENEESKKSEEDEEGGIKRTTLNPEILKKDAA